ncbi:hypothetical protein [Microvirga calopogonii]|uniref:hypothetical protein n=1 Tax=Microvirga calopogonii TaxID=2078013 RepID=UPI000E0D334B|nr:hypothetical protein [Microvirga calopogonii]
MAHKFKVRQLAGLNQPGFSDAQTTSAGVYEVVWLMPADQTGEVSYRIKACSIERAVRESKIRST